MNRFHPLSIIRAFSEQTRRIIGGRYVLFLSGAVFIATALLTWFGYRAALQWQDSTRSLAEQRESEVVTLMVTALSRDMRGVQSQILPQLAPYDPSFEQAPEFEDDIAKAFARFPYPESFFSWTANEDFGVLYAFYRADRPPSWLEERYVQPGREFPTLILKEPGRLKSIIGPLQRQAATGARFLLMETTIGGKAYQVVARPVTAAPDSAVDSIIGFTVNIEWVRTHYFSEIATQLSNIVEGERKMALTIVDDTGMTITSTDPDAKRRENKTLSGEKQFPFFFFDPVLNAAVPSDTLPIRYWTASAQSIDDESGLAAGTGAGGTFVLISFAALASGVALILSARQTWAAAQLAKVKFEFVSAVTHELKTPLAAIRLVSETLARGRFSSLNTIEECSAVLLAEVSRLTRTVDNLLIMARVQDVQQFYSFEAVDVSKLVDETLEVFLPALHEREFVLTVDIPPSLPSVRADRLALKQVLENLLDNAIRYSQKVRDLRIAVSAGPTQITLAIVDKGSGIPSNELHRVSERFFRGRNAAPGGTGLGLSIAYRIIRDHHGEIELHSNGGVGTAVHIKLPVMDGKNDDDEATDLGG